MSVIKVIHIDDHDLVISTVKKLVEEKSPIIKIVATAKSYPELFHLLNTIESDVLLLDGQITGGTMDDNLPIIRRTFPQLKIILLWIGTDENSLTKWFEFIDGQLNLGCNTEELIEAIERVANGDNYFALPIFNKHRSK